jgi:alkylhydroperoxidase family enzyme
LASACYFRIEPIDTSVRMYGLTDEEIAAIREGRFDSFAAPELALLQMADAMTDTPANVSNDFYAELRWHFSEEQLIELAASVASENFRARMNRVFDVGSDGLYRKGLAFKVRAA